MRTLLSLGLLILTLLSAASAPAWADTLFVDSFNYTPLSGSLTGATGTLWTAHNAGTNQWQLSGLDLDGTGGSVAWPGLPLLDQQAKAGGATAISSGKVYIGFLLNLTDISSMTGTGYFMRPMDSTYNNYTSNAYLSIIPDPDGDMLTDDFALGSRFIAGTSGSLELGTTYEVIWGLDLDAEQMAIWVDGVQEVSWTSLDGARTLNNVTGVMLVDWGGGGTPTGGNIDRIRVATTFGEAVPEPATWVLLGIGCIGWLCWRRRR